MKRFLLIGCGNMGSAILKGIFRDSPNFYVDVVDHTGKNSQEFKHQEKFQLYSSVHDIKIKPNLVLFAVKPQHMKELLSTLPSLIQEADAFISVAAGKTISFLEQYLGQKPIIRGMPNTPASIGKGVTLCIGNAQVTKNIQNETEKLFNAIGNNYWIEKESDMDAVTALSGSGPAYLFYVTEILAKIGQKMGLPEELSLLLASKTMIGAASLMEASQDSPETLRHKVTSPNGTTQAALEILMQNQDLENLFEHALFAAQKRSRELST